MAVDSRDDVQFVAHADSKGGRNFPLRVSVMSQDHAEFWDEHVQPAIDSGDAARADRDWDWPSLWRLLRWLGAGLRQEPVLLTLDVELANGDLIPCAMFAGVRNYRFPNAPHMKSCFVWYMTAAPASVLPGLLDCDVANVPRQLTRFCLDIGVTLSFRRGHRGRLWLHASPDGEELPKWYARQGMANLMQSAKLPFGVRALLGNDGRYFCYDEESAAEASRALDTYRDAVKY
ncbi:MAG: hypothetical protein QOI24_3930 [Acidobacteriota bacterium]|jgi:hypothetical protein|nr:hypothetical protein [Acidobacteriota bacterium]